MGVYRKWGPGSIRERGSHDKGHRKACPGVFIASLFIGKQSLQESQTPETTENVWSSEDLPLVEEDRFWGHLKSLVIYKVNGPARMLLEEVLEANVNVTPSFKMREKKYLENYRQMKQIILEILSKPVKDKKLIWSSCHRFMKGKLCLKMW